MSKPIRVSKRKADRFVVIPFYEHAKKWTLKQLSLKTLRSSTRCTFGVKCRRKHRHHLVVDIVDHFTGKESQVVAMTCVRCYDSFLKRWQDNSQWKAPYFIIDKCFCVRRTEIVNLLPRSKRRVKKA